MDTLNMLSYRLLVSMISANELVVNIIGVSLKVMSCFFLTAFKFLMAFDLQHFY